MTRLYEIGEEIVHLINQLEELDAPPELIRDTLEANFGTDFEEKAAAVAGYIKNLKAEAAMFNEESKRLKEKAKVRENQMNRTKHYLDTWMQLTGKTRIEHGVHTIKYRKGTEVADVDLEQLPDEYWIVDRKPPTVTEIKAMLKAGQTVPGAKLVRNPDTLQID